eukprot:Gb_21717 [translate_table: standard]
MASTCLVFPQAILVTPLTKHWSNAQNFRKSPTETKLSWQQASKNGSNAQISRSPSLGFSFSDEISFGYLSERRILSAFSSPRAEAAVSTVEDGSTLIPADGGFLEEKEEEGGNPVGCQACGKLEIEKGCNGEGRIQGGIGTIPGFTWWPIKAYRPCPGFVASGGRYKRRGQSMDEVAFGRKGMDDDLDIKERLKRR